MYAEASAARKATTRAISSGRPMRRIGIAVLNDLITFAGTAAVISVSIAAAHRVDGNPDAVGGDPVRLGQCERGLAGERLREPNRPDFEAA
jgi:hypothetical protein